MFPPLGKADSPRRGDVAEGSTPGKEGTQIDECVLTGNA